MVTRLLVVADLHYPSRPRRVWGLLRLLEGSSVDALVLAGDFLDAPMSRYVEKLFWPPAPQLSRPRLCGLGEP